MPSSVETIEKHRSESEYEIEKCGPEMRAWLRWNGGPNLETQTVHQKKKVHSLCALSPTKTSQIELDLVTLLLPEGPVIQPFSFYASFPIAVYWN